MTPASDNITPSATTQTAAPERLPFRDDVPLAERVINPPAKDIHKTLGGRLTHFFIYGVLGFAANAGLSVGITYFAMPREKVIEFKKGLAKGIEGLFKFMKYPERAAAQTVEILIMMTAGTILTSAMIPLIKRRDRIAHSLNKALGTDTDALPDHLKPMPIARTQEEKIEIEVNKRVNRKHSSADVWKARWAALSVPFIGNFILSDWNSRREGVDKATKGPVAYKKWSLDTKVWEAGSRFYDKVLSKKSWVGKLSNFFENHGASVEAIKEANENTGGDRILEAIVNKSGGTPEQIKGRFMVAEQTRMLTKEVGWTVILAIIMERLVSVFHDKRVKKDEQQALADITKEGLVPQGYKAVLDEGVTFERIKPPASSWVDKSGAAKTAETTRAAILEASRTADKQPAPAI